MQTRGGWLPIEVGFDLTGRGRAGAEAGMACEVGGGAAARHDHGDRGEHANPWEAGLADLGLRLDEAKQLTAALQAEMVSAQVAAVGERRRWCAACGRPLASKGHYRATFRSLFGDVPVRVRRLLVCSCHGPGEPKSFAALDLGAGLAPELAYVTAKFAAVAPFGKVAALLSELLPLSGAQNAGTVRNRTLRAGQEVVQQHPTKNAELPATPAAGPVVVGLDGGYVRSRHRPERHFEVVAGKVIDARGTQHRFALTRNGQATSAAAFRQALATAGVQADTRRCCATAMPGCGGCSARCCQVPRSCWTGGTRPCALSTRCRRPVALARLTRPLPTTRFAPWTVRSGACGMGAGRGAGANSLACAAGRGASTCAMWPA